MIFLQNFYFLLLLFTLYFLRFTLDVLQFTFYNVLLTLHTLLFTLYSLLFRLRQKSDFKVEVEFGIKFKFMTPSAVFAFAPFRPPLQKRGTAATPGMGSIFPSVCNSSNASNPRKRSFASWVVVSSCVSYQSSLPLSGDVAIFSLSRTMSIPTPTAPSPPPRRHHQRAQRQPPPPKEARANTESKGSKGNHRNQGKQGQPLPPRGTLATNNQHQGKRTTNTTDGGRATTSTRKQRATNSQHQGKPTTNTMESKGNQHHNFS